jgi:uncharacterized protein (TIGR00369 family)
MADDHEALIRRVRPPDGFEFTTRAAFVNHVGPILQARENAPGIMRLGLRVEPVHCNSFGVMHGGMTATLCDSAMARAVVFALKRRSVTLKMTMEYFEPIHPDEWIDVCGELAWHDDSVAHTQCDVRVDGQVRATATAVFRLLRHL